VFRFSLQYVIVVAMMLTSGCTSDLNARLELGASQRTPTFDFSHTPTATPGARPRDQWETTVVVVPLDAVVHNPAPRPIYTYPITERPRVYGLFPTASTATRSQSTPWMVSLLQSLDETADSVLALFDPWFYNPNRTYWSPREVWKRTPHARTWSSGRPINHESDTP
jgi:hypothetical protein